jgi:hypothetical protein
MPLAPMVVLPVVTVPFELIETLTDVLPVVRPEFEIAVLPIETEFCPMFIQPVPFHW